MTRTPLSGLRPDNTCTVECIYINMLAGLLMSPILACGRPFSIDADPAGMTIVTPLPPPAAGPDEGRITSRKTLYERFKTRLNENLDERKQ